MDDTPNYDVKQAYPTAAVIDAYTRKAQMAQNQQQYQQQQFLQSMQTIGQVGQSLMDRKRSIAQSLALGKQYGIPEDQAKLMTPDQVFEVGKQKSQGTNMMQAALGSHLALHPEALSDPNMQALISKHFPGSGNVPGDTGSSNQQLDQTTPLQLQSQFQGANPQPQNLQSGTPSPSVEQPAPQHTSSGQLFNMPNINMSKGTSGLMAKLISQSNVNARANPQIDFDTLRTVAATSGRPELADQLIETAKKAGNSSVNRKDLDEVLKGVGLSNQASRANFYETMARTKQQQTELNVTKTLSKYSGADAAASATTDATKRLSNIQRAYGIISRIEAQGGEATERQRSELAAATAQTINPTGVMTDARMLQFVPNTYRGKFGNFQEALTNKSVPIDFKGFVPEFRGLLDAEKEINQGLIDNARGYAKPYEKMLRSMNPKLADSAHEAAANNPLTNPKMGNPSQAALNPDLAHMSTADLLKLRDQMKKSRGQ